MKSSGGLSTLAIDNLERHVLPQDSPGNPRHLAMPLVQRMKRAGKDRFGRLEWPRT